MYHRFALAGLAAGGGLMAAAFLQAAVAIADSGSADPAPSATGADAFTIHGTTFDPFTASDGNFFPGAPSGTETEGFSLVGPLNTAPPLLTLGGGSALGLDLAPQYFEVYSGSGSGPPIWAALTPTKPSRTCSACPTPSSPSPRSTPPAV